MEMNRRLRDGLSAVAIGTLLAGTLSCSMARREHTADPSIHAQGDISASTEQIRLRMRSLVGPFCGEVEQTADAIIAETRDRSVQRAALLWKIEAVPALREALFQPNPLTAVLDTWVLSFQMIDYFDRGQGKASFGAEQPRALAACRHIEQQVSGVAAAMSRSGDVSKARAFAEKWAAEHPVTGSIADRQSALTRALEVNTGDSFTAGQAVAEITVTVDDLNRRIEVYSDQLFRQARWEAQLLQTNLVDDLQLDTARPMAERALVSAETAVATLDRLAPLLEQAVATATGAPTLIANERVAALADLRDEITRTLTFLQEQRIAALQQLTRERTETMLQLHADLTVERQALTADLEKVSMRVVDHAFLRIAQLLVALVGVAFIGLLLFVKLWRH